MPPNLSPFCIFTVLLSNKANVIGFFTALNTDSTKTTSSFPVSTSSVEITRYKVLFRCYVDIEPALQEIVVRRGYLILSNE